MTVETVLSELKGFLSPDQFLEGEDVHRRRFGLGRGNCRARAIVRPRTTEEVSKILRLCNEAGQSVVTHGGLTGLVGGCTAEEDELALSTELMNQVEEIDASSRTAIVQAGTPLQALQTAVEEQGLFFPLDLGARGTATIGGNIATNAGGNRVIRYGMTRNLVYGLEVVLADGTVLDDTKKFLKNNTGYDLKHLFLGSEGTLGVVTRAVLRLFPKPRTWNTALVAVDSAENALELLNFMEPALGGSMTAFEVMWKNFYELSTRHIGGALPLPLDYQFYILIESIDSNEDGESSPLNDALEKALERELIQNAALAMSPKQYADLWAIRDGVECLAHLFPFVAFDVSLPPREMFAYADDVVAELSKKIDPLQWVSFGHLGDGNIHLTVSYKQGGKAHLKIIEDTVYGRIRDRKGSISAEHGIGLLKKDYLEHSRSKEEIEVMRRLKQAMDPKNILNPGKIF